MKSRPDGQARFDLLLVDQEFLEIMTAKHCCLEGEKSHAWDRRPSRRCSIFDFLHAVEMAFPMAEQALHPG